jgi:hypothetical protein
MPQIHVPVSGRETVPQRKLLCIVTLALGIAMLASHEATAASVNPTSLTFQAVQGGTSPSSQTISVNKGNNGPDTWTAIESAAWLSVSPGTGSIKRTAQITVSINPSGLAAGSYTTTVFINLSKDGSTSFPVTLTISPSSTTTGGTTTPTATITMASSVAPGSSVPITVARSPQSTTDWIAFFAAGSPASSYMNWIYVPASSPVTVSLVAPTVSGAYELRLYLNNTYTLAATKPVTVGGTSLATNTSAVLTWDLGTDTTLAGYKVYVGTTSGLYNYPGSPFTVTNVGTYTVNNLPSGQTYFFAVSAFDTNGNDSALSPEVSKSIY